MTSKVNTSVVLQVYRVGGPAAETRGEGGLPRRHWWPLPSHPAVWRTTKAGHPQPPSRDRSHAAGTRRQPQQEVLLWLRDQLGFSSGCWIPESASDVRSRSQYPRQVGADPSHEGCATATGTAISLLVPIDMFHCYHEKLCYPGNILSTGT